jgi:hypothetical protein
MQPFFRYYGGKWRLAERLGPPQRDNVIEPFPGSAAYSCFWEPKKVTPIERDPVVAGVWKFLKRVSPAELKRLPSDISHVDELPSRVCQEAKWLIGRIGILKLAKWCKRRRSFVQVCENDGAKWLRFEPLSIVRTHRARGYTAEAVFEIEN